MNTKFKFHKQKGNIREPRNYLMTYDYVFTFFTMIVDKKFHTFIADFTQEKNDFITSNTSMLRTKYIFNYGYKI